MTNTQHTPGPWRATANTRGGKPTGSYTVQTNSDGFACSVICESTEANARLIAAAPELLEATETLLSMLEHIQKVCGGLPKGFTNPNTGESSHMERARAVIAKAKAA